MKLIGKLIKKLVIQSELSSFIGTRFYNSLAPQKAAFPLAVGRVTGIDPVDFKMHGHNDLGAEGRGRACTDNYTYRVQVFSKDAEEAATMASKVRKVLDRALRGSYDGIVLSGLKFTGAVENPFLADDMDLFSWDIDFDVRIDFSTDDL